MVTSGEFLNAVEESEDGSGTARVLAPSAPLAPPRLAVLERFDNLVPKSGGSRRAQRGWPRRRLRVAAQ